MCGISGLFFQKNINQRILTDYGLRMSDALSKRGPDSSGIWYDSESGIVLSHRRLSIRDLSIKGHQPMLSHDKSLMIVFNGEIYNFEDLKKELGEYKWEGNSDTEVLLTAIQKWGLKSALMRCHGMFSFALWNLKSKSLIIARDRFGEKPLYWGIIKLRDYPDEIMSFASDLASIWSLPGIKKEIEHKAFSNFLKYGYVSAPDSIQKGIYQLKPGHIVEIKYNNKLNRLNLPKPRTWWNIDKVSLQSFSSQNSGENISLLEDTLKKVIKEQSLADVTTASFLSGGIDSSLIAALLQSQSTKKIKTYNISFKESGNNEGLFDEGPYAKKIANYLDTEHTEIDLTPKDIKRIIPKIPFIYTEPFSDASQLATSIICQEISNLNIKVALTGDGADELFGGYNRHFYAPLINKNFKNYPYLLKKFFTKLMNIFPTKNSDLSQEKKRKLINSILKSNHIQTIYDSIISNNNNIELFHKYPENESSDISFFKSLKAPTISEKVMLADTISYLPNNILVKLDRAAMHYGLETRSPFLDDRVAEIAWNTNLDNKIYNKKIGYSSKYILKEILFKYIPKENFDRPKTGFSIPIASWLRGPLKDWANDLLSYDLINKQDFLSSHNVKKIWESHLKGNSSNTELIWTILMWQCWLENWENI